MTPQDKQVLNEHHRILQAENDFFVKGKAIGEAVNYVALLEAIKGIKEKECQNQQNRSRNQSPRVGNLPVELDLRLSL